MENEIRFKINEMGSLDVESMYKVIEAHRALTTFEDIMETGFNKNSGYVYIALENGISICSCFGQDVEYLVTNYEDGEETFYTTYKEAQEHYTRTMY